MAITNEDIVALASAFHDASMVKKSTAAEMAEFFLYPESRIFVLHGGDLTLQANHEIHQKLVDEIHWTVGTRDITPLGDNPERARAQGIVYWQGRHVDQADGALLKCHVGEDWVVERVPSGELKFVIYVNSFHRFLPDAAPDRDQVTTTRSSPTSSTGRSDGTSRICATSRSGRVPSARSTGRRAARAGPKPR